VNRQLAPCGFRFLGNRQNQHTVFVACIGLGIVQGASQRETAAGIAVGAFAAQDPAIVLFLLFTTDLSAQRDLIALNADIDVLFVDKESRP